MGFWEAVGLKLNLHPEISGRRVYLRVGTHGICTQHVALLDNTVRIFLVPKTGESSSPGTVGLGIECKAGIPKWAECTESVTVENFIEQK